MALVGGTVTVFGGSGFIGRYVVGRLADLGWTIRVAGRDPERAKFLQPLGSVGQIVPIACNIGDESRVRALLSGVDAAVNLVGILAETRRQRFAEIQRDGAASVARLAAAGGIEALVQVSAIGAHPDSRSAYARTKAEAEIAVREAMPGATIIRPSIVFGPEDSFFNRFAAMARISPVLPLIGGGHTRFQPVYVTDVADAIVRCLLDPDRRGRTFEVGGPEVRSFRELMELMLRVIGRRRLLLSLPFPLAGLLARIAQLLPVSSITRDQVELLKQDNVVSGDYPGLAELGIAAHSLEVELPTYLGRFRPGGRLGSLR